MINTILLDLVGVLFFPNINVEANPLIDEIDCLIGGVTNDLIFKKKILREYNLTEAKFHNLLQAIVDKYEPYIPLWDLLLEQKQHYKLGIVNNGTYLTVPFFEEKYHLSRQFDFFVSSAIEGFCKPNRLIYMRACEKSGSQPRECLFMDDSMENILGAQRVGMQTIHWLDRESGFRAFKHYFYYKH